MQVFIPTFYYAVALDIIYIDTTGFLFKYFYFLKKSIFIIFIVKVLILFQ